MDKAIAQEIAQQILRQQFHENWPYYLLLIALIFLATVGAAFLGSYAQARGKNFATKADLESVTDQLRVTTAATEQVKTAIARIDWADREWRVLRRVKLEELFDRISIIKHFYETEAKVRLFSDSLEAKEDPVMRLDVLLDLYFPELVVEGRRVIQASYTYKRWLIERQRAYIAAPAGPERAAAVNASVTEFAEQQGKFSAPFLNLEQAGAALMRSIVNA